MNITLSDPRNLAVCVVNPQNGNCYNWMTSAWETFNAQAHLRPISVVSGLPPVFSTLQTAYIELVLLNYPNSVATLLTVDNSGNPTTLADVWTAPFPVNYPVGGGFSR